MWTCGGEGRTTDVKIPALRERQARNFLAALLLLQGVPMPCAGDEILRTQQGNNNAYCQDYEISWFDWSLDRSRGDVLAFTRSLMGGRLYMVERGDDRGKSGEHSGRG